MAYDVEGDGAHAIAFAHGWCSKAAHWDAQAEAFRSSYRIVRWDRRGMGRALSSQPADSPARHADDLAAILDAEGIDKVTVVGHAGGGPSAVTFAVQHSQRVEGLILVDTRLNAAPADGQPNPWGDYIETMCSQLLSDGAPYFDTLYRSFFGHRAPAAVVDDAVANALATSPETAAAELRHMSGDTAALARRVACPVLWVSTQPDDTASVRQLFDDLTVGHVVGSGHFLQLEVPDQLNPMIAAFLADKVVGP